MTPSLPDGLNTRKGIRLLKIYSPTVATQGFTLAQAVQCLDYGSVDRVIVVPVPALATEPFFSPHRECNPVLGSTQLHIQWVAGAEQAGHEDENSPPFTDKVKNAWS